MDGHDQIRLLELLLIVSRNKNVAYQGLRF